ncbi:MAG: HEAT repeat domain-containing protein [Bacteroidales bacterium]|nr:MAG: HEAT repeat domain-containing protein [Bacteroidales bacterium]
MNCNDIKNMFIDYLDNNLDNQAKSDFKKHLKKCKECSGALAQLQLINKKISGVKMVKTPDSVFENYMFNLEKEKYRLNSRMPGIFGLPGLKTAASILLFITGSLFGVLLTKSYLANTRVKDLENEVGKLKQVVAVSIFGQNTTSDKIKALNYYDETGEADQKYVSAIAHALRSDDNVNVRLAAAKALFRYKDTEDVKELLIRSLIDQNEPMVQIVLIKFLVDNKEKEAVESLRNLINNDETNIVVRQYAEKGLQTLL